ncbi:MAG: DUF2252 domain-containing protein [Halieaceae bacterium]|jgi:uncharacterized protein (DUF2252 family)|nr:DUF2252 domain-containing protein [Halieaceae bacterium]
MPNPTSNPDSDWDFLKATPAERYDRGRSRREVVPLEAHVEAAAATGRANSLTILAGQDKSRLADLVPIRYGRMSRTPFTFLRGAAAIMASDLAAGASSGLRVELCGDAHLGNFRWYFAPNRDQVFDLNDFDETLPGPFEWDVKRLAASVTVAARANGCSGVQARAATRSAIRYYRKSIAEASELSPLDLHYYRFNSRTALERIEKHGGSHRKWKEDVLAKASRNNSLRAFDKLTDIVDGRRVIVPDPPLIVRFDGMNTAGESDAVGRFLDRYRQSLALDRRMLLDRFSLVDIARKVVGVGSVGIRCLIVLLEAGDGTPLLLQFKQALPSVLEAHLGASAFEQAGQRVVEGQRLIQATSDVLLGWAQWQEPDGQELHFYFRQLWDGKGKIDIEELGPKRLAAYAGLCGKALAFAHARSGDAMMIRGYIGDDRTFDDIMVEYADRYADITERDQMQLCEAIDNGAIDAVRDI